MRVTSAHMLRLPPVLCSFSALILVMLAFFAGNSPGVLDNYDIITVNTSGLGTHLANKDTARTAIHTRAIIDDDCGVLDRILGKCSPAAPDATATSAPPPAPSPVQDKVNNTANDISDALSKKLHDFYSLYALAACEGDFTADGNRRISTCYSYFSTESSNIPSLLLSSLDLDLNLSPSDVGLPSTLKSALDGLDTLLKAFAVMFCIGIGFTGLAFLSSIPALALSSDDGGNGYTWSVWSNLVFTSTALFFLVLGGLVAAIGAKVAEGRVNDLGEDVGVGAVAGTAWVSMAWAGIALMVGVLLYWVWRVVKLRHELRRAQREARMAEEEEGRPRPMPMEMDMPPPPMHILRGVR
ncbi:protein ECM7 [Chaetomidium leptoderma]|uniref:Protein ECM7 n=1 Tax=Chaetomidium leptoderma TaxID=669021 RepID=A0AAN6VSP4_9PEZI|nr:protein ECM7 [Chaetomidium leptoderma]